MYGSNMKLNFSELACSASPKADGGFPRNWRSFHCLMQTNPWAWKFSSRSDQGVWMNERFQTLEVPWHTLPPFVSLGKLLLKKF